jgi:hypothetical protein
MHAPSTSAEKNRAGDEYEHIPREWRKKAVCKFLFTLRDTLPTTSKLRPSSTGICTYKLPRPDDVPATNKQCAPVLHLKRSNGTINNVPHPPPIDIPTNSSVRFAPPTFTRSRPSLRGRRKDQPGCLRTGAETMTTLLPSCAGSPNLRKNRNLLCRSDRMRAARSIYPSPAWEPRKTPCGRLQLRGNHHHHQRVP